MADIPLHGSASRGRKGPPAPEGGEQKVVDPGKNVVPPEQTHEPSPVRPPDEPTPKRPPPSESG